MRAADVALTVIDLDGGDSACRAAWPLLNAAERERAGRFRFDRDRRRWGLARAGLRRVLGAALDVGPQTVVIATDAQGKPYLSDHPDLHFNLSHSADVALVAWTRLAPVGVDVERIKEIADRERVCRRVFSACEREQLAALPEGQRTRAFYLGWTRKEALIKATGEGMRAPLRAYSVALAPDAPPRVLADERAAAGMEPWHLWHTEPRPGYVAAAALRCAPTPRFELA